MVVLPIWTWNTFQDILLSEKKQEKTVYEDVYPQ